MQPARISWLSDFYMQINVAEKNLVCPRTPIGSCALKVIDDRDDIGR